MDPLSFTASIITVVGVGGNIAKTLRYLASQKNAPDFVLLLNNELADLHLIVVAIQDIYQTQQLNRRLLGHHNISIDNSIISALTQAQQTVTNLQTLYDRMNATSGQRGVANLKTKLWLLEPSKTRKVLEDLRNARLKLAGVLGILNSYVTHYSVLPSLVPFFGGIKLL